VAQHLSADGLLEAEDREDFEAIGLGECAGPSAQLEINIVNLEYRDEKKLWRIGSSHKFLKFHIHRPSPSGRDIDLLNLRTTFCTVLGPRPTHLQDSCVSKVLRH
jgi:hypothetical protein